MGSNAVGGANQKIYFKQQYHKMWRIIHKLLNYLYSNINVLMYRWPTPDYTKRFAAMEQSQPQK